MSLSNDIKLNTNYNFVPLKIIMFADVQVRSHNDVLGNQDSTSNAYIALKNNFKYAKYINADVIMINGDIVNNAISSYYKLFWHAFTQVYGKDESVYPEFVMNIGNHEWWNVAEKEVGYSLSMFKKYARINSPNLVKQTVVTYELDKKTTLPTYYKVIKGVPFLVISGKTSWGNVTGRLKREVKTWIREIKRLPSVKQGGPIFVEYHCPLFNVTYGGGQDYKPYKESKTIDKLFKKIPNAIVFTGDTHFNAVNERTINQVDYTSINVGTSSYPRSMYYSATRFTFDNVYPADSRFGAGRMSGDVNFMSPYNSTVMVITMDSQAVTKIDRYYTADNPCDAKKIGITWEIPKLISKNDFIYTHKRIKSVEWANKIYGKDYLQWASGESVKIKISNNKMLVNFNDVTDFNAVEHYRIKTIIKDSLNNVIDTRFNDYMSHYYKYDDTPHTYNFVINDIKKADNYEVTVTAYDFFDNQSKNCLKTNIVDNSLIFPTDIEIRSINTYSNLSKRINYLQNAINNNACVEYYFKGTKRFSSGFVVERVILENDQDCIKEFLSVKKWENAELSFKVKNDNDFDVRFGLNIETDRVISNGEDFQITIPKNSDFVTVKWNLNQTFNISGEDIKKLELKLFVPDEVVNDENGYLVRFFIDDFNIF